jgi:nucleoside-diphosphate-sugar epimerase
MFENTYKNKKVLITGHTGFKGSWLAIWLKELGAEVIGYALDPPSDPNNFEATKLQEKITHIHGDVRDIDHLLETFRKYQPEFVYHLAAQPIVRLSYDEPKLTFDTNVGGTVNVFEAVRKTPSVKVLVNITSDKCYENREWVWGYRENDPMGGHDPYSASKGCSELVFNAYLRSFFSSSATTGRTIGAASARAGNVIGGGDWGADRLIKYWGNGAWEDLSDPKALHEANLLKLNCDKAHAELNWRSALTIDECLQMTADWYKIFYAAPPRNSMYETCKQQIAEYFKISKRYTNVAEARRQN